MTHAPIPHIPRADWPTDHEERFAEALAPGTLLLDGGALSRYPAWHQAKIALAWGRWLAYCATRGLEPTDPAVFTQTNLAPLLEELQAQRAPATVWSIIRNLRIAAGVIAPGADLHMLKLLEQSLARNRAPRKRLTELPAAADLCALGFSLMERARHQLSPIKQAAQYRDGLMLALLIARPLRIGNFGALEIGKHLLQSGKTFTLKLDATETKNKRPHLVRVPKGLTEPLQHYLEHVRPRLLRGHGRWSREPSKALWISEHGSALTPKAMGARLRALLKRELGINIGPHALRTILATTIAVEDPAHVQMIQPLLNHHNPSTAERYYNLASTVDAARRFERVVQQLKQSKAVEQD